MDLRELILALMNEDALTARQWIIDANRIGVRWADIPQPRDFDAAAMAVSAGVVELLASRSQQAPPMWTAAVPAAPQPIWLVSLFADLPRTRKMCEEQGPEPLRRRQIFAPPDFLTAA